MKLHPRLKAPLALFICLFFVPILGLLTARYMANELEGQFHDSIVFTQRLLSDEDYKQRQLSYASVCSKMEAAGATAETKAVCSPADEVALVDLSSWTLGALGISILFLIYGARWFTGTNRARLSWTFGLVVRAVMLLLAIAVLGQAALFVFSVYTLESTAIHRVHGVLLGTIAVAAIAACWSLLRFTFGLFKSQPMLVKAIALSRDEQPELYAFVDDIANRLNAQSPKNIIAGIEPNFFVTASPINLFGHDRTLTNETLFISLAMMRLFDKREFAAVVGHELGHFRGDDTTYSMRFAPTYARLGKAWTAMSVQSGGAADIARLPAMVMLGTCWNVFASAERTIGRERELLADKAGAEASDSPSLARALVKISTHAVQWGHLTRAHIDQLAEGRTFTNLSTTFEDGCRTALGAMDWKAARDALGSSTQAHPVDTHPPLSQRLDNLGTSLDELDVSDIALPVEASIELVRLPEEIEKQLSVLEAQWLVAIRAVVVPQTE
ncbi:M48 family metallopeptidase [Paraburkholderia madseniana]|uniref:M48 family metallopeptidase n=1 Tax=Paraburkholderia madseniana TaxID=2599607 RepID=UPI0015C52A71|nr:M48 family metallopeptidase [Paraburkholderia madseniana]NPT67398.1 M48 family metalloprotease [Paraburkholderia madseniana]